ncbi:MAG: NAD(P)-dependent oxidoreductase [Pseudomonadota bacterium]
MAKVAWIGLGVMGYPMAGHVLQKGRHELTVYNRTAAKAERWVGQYGSGKVAATPEEAADGADYVFCCVGNDDDLRSVTTGPAGAFHSMKPNSVFIDNTTASATVARELHAIARDMGFGFLDAPVSGGQAGAERGILTVMTGGNKDVFARALPVIECYARQVTLIGEAGAGQLCKMVNQICIAGLLQALSEGLHFARQAGLDMQAVMTTIDKGAAGSWQMENRWENMSNGKFDHGFAVDWMRKDLDIALAEARQNQASLPVTGLVDQFYAYVQKAGGGHWDTSSLITRLNKVEN